MREMGSGSRVFVTGGAGFIGSHVCDKILEMGNEVVCFDNLSTGFKENIEHMIGKPGFSFVEGDIRDLDLLREHVPGCTHVCHQAALGSVPRSIKDPVTTNDVNLSGSLNLLSVSKDCSITRFVYASSSSVYGDNMDMPKREEDTGKVLSPYAVTKSAFEDYARVFFQVHGVETIGLRYFNVFGPRQSPEGAYAAVIPLFMESMYEQRRPKIFGDGEQTRDFTYVQNAVRANILALFGEVPLSYGGVFNVACGETFTINRIYRIIHNQLNKELGQKIAIEPEYESPRSGDIRDSLADLSKVSECLGYSPEVDFVEGIKRTVNWFVEFKE